MHASMCVLYVCTATVSTADAAVWHVGLRLCHWLYFRTLCCSKGQIKKHRNPHKGWGCRVNGNEGDYPQTNMHITTTGQCWQRRGESETGKQSRLVRSWEWGIKQCTCEEDSFWSKWKLSRDDRRDHLRVLGYLFCFVFLKILWPSG